LEKDAELNVAMTSLPFLSGDFCRAGRFLGRWQAVSGGSY
jgi:hypothetical protein